MQDKPEAFAIVSDAVLAQIIRGATTRLTVVAPAVSKGAGEAIADRIRGLPVHAVTIVLDSEPEVYRLGYGTQEGFDLVWDAAQEQGVVIRRQPGIRVGVIVTDRETVVYAPTAALIEAGPNTAGGANAVRLAVPDPGIETDLGQAGDIPRVGTSAMSADAVEATRVALSVNPPQKFDVARKVRVFNAAFEFVELEIRGTEVSRRTVRIPSYLLAVTDKHTRKRLEAKFRLVPPDDELSGQRIANDRRLLLDRFLRVIPRFGTAVLRSERAEFDKAIEQLRASVEQFRVDVRDRLRSTIEKNIDDLVASLTPALVERPPDTWTLSTGERPTKEDVQTLLRRDLRRAFGSADALVREMSIRCLFKGVTYELLDNAAFVKAAADVFPELMASGLHDEFDAARESPPD